MTIIKIILIISLLAMFSCSQKELKSPFIDNLKNGDTLTLYAKFADCGEWGGHIEKIYITKTTNVFNATFYKDTVSCENDPNLSRKKTIEISKPLSITNKNIIVKYINIFLVKADKEVGMLGHSCNLYELISKEKTYKYLDSTENWKEFIIMRTEIFTE